MTNMKPQTRQRYSREFEWWRFTFDIRENINRQCVCFGFSVNWNYRPSIEVGFCFWTLNLEYVKPTKLPQTMPNHLSHPNEF